MGMFNTDNLPPWNSWMLFGSSLMIHILYAIFCPLSESWLVIQHVDMLSVLLFWIFSLFRFNHYYYYYL